MMNMFPCKIVMKQRENEPILNVILETKNEKMLTLSLIRIFLKCRDISLKYEGEMYTQNESIMFPVQPGKMYMSFSLIFSNEYKLREFIEVIKNLRPEDCF